MALSCFRCFWNSIVDLLCLKTWFPGFCNLRQVKPLINLPIVNIKVAKHFLTIMSSKKENKLIIQSSCRHLMQPSRSRQKLIIFFTQDLNPLPCVNVKHPKIIQISFVFIDILSVSTEYNNVIVRRSNERHWMKGSRFGCQDSCCIKFIVLWNLAESNEVILLQVILGYSNSLRLTTPRSYIPLNLWYTTRLDHFPFIFSYMKHSDFIREVKTILIIINFPTKKINRLMLLNEYHFAENPSTRAV